MTVAFGQMRLDEISSVYDRLVVVDDDVVMDDASSVPLQDPDVVMDDVSPSTPADPDVVMDVDHNA
jgi:hypothetical protein